MTSARRLVAATALALALAGWRAASGAEEQQLDLGQVLGVARAINAGEVDQARAVKDRLEGDAKRFAEIMIREHGAALERLSRLADELGIDPAVSELRRDLEQRSREAIRALRDAEDDEVSRKYVESQVEMHRRALEVIDGKLLPAAREEPRLESSLREMRAHVAAHLRTAEELRR